MMNNTQDAAVKKEEQNIMMVIHPSRYRTPLGRNNQSTGSHLYSFTDDNESIVDAMEYNIMQTLFDSTAATQITN